MFLLNIANVLKSTNVVTFTINAINDIDATDTY